MITAFTDGACRVSNPGLCSCAWVAYAGTDTVEWASGSHYLGPELHTNNYAEYMGVLKFLEWASKNREEYATIFCDSELVVGHINGTKRCLKDELRPLLNRAQLLMIRGRHTIQHIDGHAGHVGNERADELCNDVLDRVQGKGKHDQGEGN